MTTDLTALLARMEAAAGPDREWDRRLWKATGQGTIRLVTGLGMNGRTPGRQTAFGPDGLVSTVPRYTASLDAALALVERVLPGQAVIVGMRQTPDTMPWARVGKPRDGADSVAPTPALALLAAMLKAMIAKGDA